jgi:D-3-phosphoglycerate dehydrogenase / 2-oxoglutarate reductase
MSQTSFDKDKIKILLLEGVHPSAVASFHSAGYRNVEQLGQALQGDELTRALTDVHMLGIRSRTQLTGPALAEARRLIAVGCFCIGTNQVALRDATLRGIPVFNAPFSNTRSVAELVLAEAVLLLRGIPEKLTRLKQGVWQKSAAASFEIRGKRLGVIGYGNIGAQLGVMAEALGMHVQFYDVVKKLNLGNAVQLDSLDELLATSDVVTLHVPATPATRELIGTREIALMRSNSVLINASRGNVVDIDALADALRTGRILGAAIDVFPQEPQSNNEPFVSPLLDCDNVIVTPHIGGSTVEAQENIGVEVADKLIRYSDNGSTLSAVNFPEVALPPHPASHRLLHIHRNAPGVLSRINQVFSEGSINIAAQYLQTNADIGYVVIDVEAEHSQAALTKLREVEGTIRTRVLF